MSRPLFQLPFHCGQVWEASTYHQPWPDQNSINLAQWDEQRRNISEAEPVLASADGTVLEVSTDPDDGTHKVVLDHGGGWVTRYLHLREPAPFIKNRKVAQGEHIGHVGNSGTSDFFLHYSQIKDGQAVRCEFNGTPIATHAGAPRTWENGEKLTSLNAAMNSFLRFHQSGSQYLLEYKPGTGTVVIDRINSTGRGVTEVWRGQWTRQWTHFIPYYVRDEGERHPYLLAYKAATGEVSFDRINPGGLGTTPVGSTTWNRGWTSILPFSVLGHGQRDLHYLTYKSSTGEVDIDEINSTGNGSTTLASANWGTGWTGFMEFWMDFRMYILAYKGGTGEVGIGRLNADNASIVWDWQGQWSKGWSHLVPFTVTGAPHLLAYKATTGLASFERIKPNAQGTDVLATTTWTKGWTTFSPFDHNGVDHYLAYKTGSGAVAIDEFNENGTGATTIWSDTWDPGWA